MHQDFWPLWLLSAFHMIIKKKCGQFFHCCVGVSCALKKVFQSKCLLINLSLSHHNQAKQWSRATTSRHPHKPPWPSPTRGEGKTMAGPDLSGISWAPRDPDSHLGPAATGGGSSRCAWTVIHSGHIGTWVFCADNSQERAHESRCTFPMTCNAAILLCLRAPIIWTGLWFPSQVGSEGVYGGKPEGWSGVACPIPTALVSKRIKDKTHILIYNIVLISLYSNTTQLYTHTHTHTHIYIYIYVCI